MRSRITYTKFHRSAWISWSEDQYFEYAKTREELDLLIEVIKEDNSIISAFYEDVANKNVIIFKENKVTKE